MNKPEQTKFRAALEHYCSGSDKETQDEIELSLVKIPDQFFKVQR